MSKTYDLYKFYTKERLEIVENVARQFGHNERRYKLVLLRYLVVPSEKDQLIVDMIVSSYYNRQAN